MNRLVIAEKPSVAQSLAAVLGAATRRDGYLEGNGWLVSWCLGHLAGLADADAYNPDYAKWRYDDLPILPESWRFTIAKDKRGQFDVLRTLLRREDVTEVVNACDAGREGELIFRTVYCLAGCTKSMKRLWISSMEDSAIREGFANLRPGVDYDGLHQAALCRAKADWMVGINATRLFSVLYHRTLNIGRVMSPTLALIVQREAEIDAFKPVPFYTVQLELSGFSAASARMDKKADAEQLKSACQGGTATVKQVERKDKTEKPPALYDLTTLQRDANRLLGYTAQQTLNYLQNLYEKKWLGDRAKPSHREQLRTAIDQALAQKPADLDGLFQLLREANCEVSKRGKSYRLKLPGWDKVARLDSLGEGYTLDDLLAVLSGQKEYTPRKEFAVQATPPKVNLLVDIQTKLQAGKGAGYARWAKVFNLKQMAQTMNFLMAHNLLEYAVLEEKTAAATARHNELSAQIKAAEKRMAEIAVLRTHIVNYAKTREVYVAYRKAGYSRKFYAEHEDEIRLHRAAKDAFNELNVKKLPTMKALQAEYAQLLTDKKKAYGKYRRARAEMRELLAAKANVDRILNWEASQEAEQQKDHGQR